MLVTNNGDDFKALLAREDAVHPGLVVLVTQVRASAQAILFRAVLNHLGVRTELINRVLEVDVDERMRARLDHKERLFTAGCLP